MTTASEKLSTLVDALIATATNAGVTFTDTQRTALYDSAASWLDGQDTVSIQLAANKPEFQQLLMQMQYALETSDSWRDANTASTGRTFLRFMAASIKWAGFAAERTAQERFPYTARMPSAILASTMSLGVRITRRVPANVTGTIIRNGTGFLQIPKYTAFVINDQRFFNRDIIIFPDGDASAVSITLYQGTIFKDNYTASGATFSRYELGSGDWSLSEDDVALTVDGVEWKRTTNGMYTVAPTDRTFAERTLPNGNIETQTGSGTYGVLPSTGAVLEFTYVSTLGAQASNNATDLPINCADIGGVTGVTTSVITGGIDPETPTFYKNNGPAIAARRERAVRRSDYEATALEYKGGVKILDARFLGQQEVDPTRKALTNIVQVALLTPNSLTGPPVSASQWANFQRYIVQNGIDRVTLVRVDPTAVDISFDLDVGVIPESNLETIESALITLYRSFYGPRYGALGRAFYSQDLMSLIRDKDFFDQTIAAQINYVKPIGATPDAVEIDRLEWLRLQSLNLNVFYTNRDYSSRETGLSG
jgi:hypothetical protein